MSRESLLEQTDKEIEEYRKALKLVSRRGRVIVWEQIDRLLDRRYRLLQGRQGDLDEVNRNP